MCGWGKAVLAMSPLPLSLGVTSAADGAMTEEFCFPQHARWDGGRNNVMPMFVVSIGYHQR